MRRLARSTRGVALVEFALMAPVLVLLLVGILEVGSGVNAYVTISAAAREGAHWAALHPGAAPSAITASVEQRVVPLDTSAMEVAASYYDGASATFLPWPESGLPAIGTTPSYRVIRVTVTYDWAPVSGFFATFAGGQMRTSSTMETLR